MVVVVVVVVVVIVIVIVVVHNRCDPDSGQHAQGLQQSSADGGGRELA